MGISSGLQKINFRKNHPFDPLRARKIHFIGIGGIGISAIAKLMLMEGKSVRGSDLNKTDISEKLERMGAEIFIGQKKENIQIGTDLVVYTPAVADDNAEMMEAKERRIPLVSYPEALGALLNDKYGIAICGTHGKSTTTSMTGLVLTEAGLDPSVVVGSKVPEFDGNLRIGSKKYFIAEACEYKRDFLEYYPKIIVLNNIELDHTDYYKDIEDYISAFTEFIKHLPPNGLLILNGDDEVIQKSKIKNQNDKLKCKILRFGFGAGNDIQGDDLKTEEGKTKFKASFQGKDLGEFVLKIPGKFNVYNALAAIAVGLRLGINADIIKKSLAKFGGIWRRFEIKGEYNGATVVSDYAHHPTAVKATIEAAREFYPGRRIFAVFQPHQHNRTKMLYKDFLKSFGSADALILVEIFDVAGREEKKDQNVSSRGMAEDIKKRMKCRSDSPAGEEESLANARKSRIRAGSFGHCPQDDKLGNASIFYAANLGETRKLIDEKIKPGDILLIMGAGDIYKVADDLARK